MLFIFSLLFQSVSVSLIRAGVAICRDIQVEVDEYHMYYSIDLMRDNNIE